MASSVSSHSSHSSPCQALTHRDPETGASFAYLRIPRATVPPEWTNDPSMMCTYGWDAAFFSNDFGLKDPRPVLFQAFDGEAVSWIFEARGEFYQWHDEESRLLWAQGWGRRLRDLLRKLGGGQSEWESVGWKEMQQ